MSDANDRAEDGDAPELGGARPPAAARPGFAGLEGQEAVTTSLRRALSAGHLPHSLLFHGPSGVGKATCAGIVAQALNCRETGPADACGACVSCRKIARGLHPDLLWIEVAPNRTQIVMEQAEEIVDAVGFRPYEGARRVVVVDQAQEMNRSVQNAILKTLEEPPPSSVIILVTPSPQALLPTVRSRCQALRFRPLPLSDVREYLAAALELSDEEAHLRAALTPGSIGKALDLDVDAYRDRRDAAEETLRDSLSGGASMLTAAEKLLSEGRGDGKIEQAVSVIAALRDVLRDLLVLRSSADPSLMVNVDRAEDWREWAERLDEEGLIGAIEAIQRATDRLRGPVRPNARLAVEHALVETRQALLGTTT